MKKKNKNYVMEQVQKKKVKFIRLWFTDILGSLKSFAITSSEFETALEDGMGFDGSSIEGFARIHESDMIAMPDPQTFQIIPWRPKEEHAVARMFCDVLQPDGKPYDGCPRWALKRNLEEAKKMGYDFYVGPELEYFYFKSAECPEGLDMGGYFDLTPLDVASDLRRETVLTLENIGIQVEYSHHEVAPSQHEIDLRYCEALKMADNAMTYRLVVKEVAMQHGVYASFMPKPIYGENGSGMHVHQSLFKGDKNAFFKKNGEYYLSDLAKHYIAGILNHIPSMTSILNQWVNSYKRLVPGYEAPVYISWAKKNRSALVRVPEYKPGKEKSTRIELRSPDPACNPYLAFSVMLAAGLDGIKNKTSLLDPVEEDIYEMNYHERENKGINTLPSNLWEAIKRTEESDLVRKALGDHIYEKFIDNKKIEWDNYRTRVSNYELEKYLPIL